MYEQNQGQVPCHTARSISGQEQRVWSRPRQEVAKGEDFQRHLLSVSIFLRSGTKHCTASRGEQKAG
jgi:hypothetical protein